MPTQTSIVDSLTAPPFASLQYVLDDTRIYTPGDWTITNFHTGGAFLLPAGTYDIGGTYGVIVAIEVPTPPGYDVQFGWSGPGRSGDVFRPRVAQVVLEHWLPISSAYIRVLVQDVQVDWYAIQWPVLVGSGSRLGLHVEPGWAVSLYYLCVL